MLKAYAGYDAIQLMCEKEPIGQPIIQYDGDRLGVPQTDGESFAERGVQRYLRSQTTDVHRRAKQEQHPVPMSCRIKQSKIYC